MSVAEGDAPPVPGAAVAAQSIDVAQPIVVVVMGVSGCGKSTVAALLSGRLGWPLAEGDAMHPQANIDKMAAGHPLTDDDRWPWLDQVAAWCAQLLTQGGCGVVTCSALKRAYRERIIGSRSDIVFAFLDGDYDTIATRLAVRRGHFMPPSLLASQFADLQVPDPDEPAERFGVGPAPAAIADAIVARFHLTPRGRTP